MWQSIIELIMQFFKSISSVSDTTKELVPVIEKKQEIRTPVQIVEAKKDATRKEIKKDNLIRKNIRTDLKKYYQKDVINQYILILKDDYNAEQVEQIVNSEFENLKENKKRLKSFNNIKKNKL
jgi:hypothetical protein